MTTNSDPSMGAPRCARTPAPAGVGRPWHLLRVGLLFASFMGYSALQSPVPGVNEPHYLTKARHYWEPEWCAGDLFLESTDAHLFFYQTVGWLTAVGSLEQAAWCGRVLALLLLAVGWDRLLSRLVDMRFGPLCVAWLFLLLHAMGNLSGEWLVGGVEAKVFSYAFVFWGCGCLLGGQVIRSGVLLGLAIAMHPIVGVWSVFVMVCATLAAARTGREMESGTGIGALWSTRGAIAAAALLVFSLPGLIPAFQMLMNADPDVARRANFIQFTYRLSHHLDPLSFEPDRYAYFGGIMAACLMLSRGMKSPAAVRWFQWLVAASVLVAIAGGLIAAGPRPPNLMPLSEVRISLLKFYPFRLADIFVPLLAAVLSVRRAESVVRDRERWSRWTPAIPAVSAIAYVVSLAIPGIDRNPSGMDPETSRNWRDVCDWIRNETPRDALVYAVHEKWAVKWYSRRPEYVNFKDCPQDPAGIVEWHERRWHLTRWSRRALADKVVDDEELTELHEATGISYLISRELPGLGRSPLYRNETFYVYGVGVGHSRPED